MEYPSVLHYWRIIATQTLPELNNAPWDAWQEEPYLIKTIFQDAPFSVTDPKQQPDFWSSQSAQPTLKSGDPSHREALCYALTLKEGQIQAIETPAQTGKEQWTLSLVASHWVNAALHHTSPPLFLITTPEVGVWQLKWQQSVDFENPLSLSWLGEGKPSLLMGLDSAQPLKKDTPLEREQAQKHFLKCCQRVASEVIADLPAAVDYLHRKITQLQTALTAGLSIAQKAMSVSERLKRQYDPIGGLEAQLARLQQQDEALEKSLSLLNTLQRCWQAQVPEGSALKLPFWQSKSAVRKLKDTFAAAVGHEGLKDPDIAELFSLPLSQLPERLNQIMEERRQERDTLHQMLVPLCHQMAELSRAELAWLNFQQQHAIKDVSAEFTSYEPENPWEPMAYFLDKTLRYPLHQWTRHYWEARSLQTDDPWLQAAMRSYAFVANTVYPETEEMPCWHTWIQDEAHRISPLAVLPHLAKAERAIALGDPSAADAYGLLSEAEDTEWCHQLSMADDEEALEDFSFSGYMASRSSWWQLASLKSVYQDTQPTSLPGSIPIRLRYNTVTHPDILTVAQTLGFSSHVISHRSSKNRMAFPPLCYCHVKGRSHIEADGRVNRQEAKQIVLWLQVNKQNLKLLEGAESSSVLLVTPFEAQRQLLISLLQDAHLGQVPVVLFSELPLSHPYSVTILSPVMSAQDPRPFPFDEGHGSLTQWALSAKDVLMVIGDMEAFDPQLHSPSGKLAKSLFALPENRLPQNQLLPQTGLKADTRVLDTIQFHALLQESFEEAEYRVVLVTPTVSETALQELRFKELVAGAAERGVEVVVYTSDKVPVSFLEVFGVTVRTVRNLHGSYLWYDNKAFYETVQGWLMVSQEDKRYPHLYVNVYPEETAIELIPWVLADLNTRATVVKKGVGV